MHWWEAPMGAGAEAFVVAGRGWDSPKRRPKSHGRVGGMAVGHCVKLLLFTCAMRKAVDFLLQPAPRPAKGSTHPFGMRSPEAAPRPLHCRSAVMYLPTHSCSPCS